MPPELTRFFIDNLPMIVLGVLGIWMILALWPDEAPRTEMPSDGPSALGTIGAAAAATGAAFALLDESEPASELPDAWDAAADDTTPPPEDYPDAFEADGEWADDVIPADELTPPA